jgi:hypothetical protein
MPPASSRSCRAALLCALIAVLTGACQRTPVEAPKRAAPAAAIPAPATEGVPHAVNPETSELRILVYRGGPLARFGHNHVLRAGDLRGTVYLAPEFHRSAFALDFSAEALIVDPADARADEGPDFATAPSAQAIEGTRANLLGPRVLDAARFPRITLHSVALQGSDTHPVVTTRVGLHGVERELSFPVAVERSRDQIVAEGTLLLSTPDFGIPSFSVMGGGLRVQEEVKIRFRIVAVRGR